MRISQIATDNRNERPRDSGAFFVGVKAWIDVYVLERLILVGANLHKIRNTLAKSG